jgi:hypothetical protein
MKVKFSKTGKIADVANQDWVFALIECGLIDEVKHSKPKKGTNFVLQQEPEVAAARPNTATWWIDGQGRGASVHARCADCKLHEVVLNVERAKFEHCGKVEHAPEAIIATYKKARAIW